MKKTMTLLALLLGLVFSAGATNSAKTQTRAFASDLIISEYVEGSSSNKAIEIFNGTGASVDLSGYTLKTAINGNENYVNFLTLSGTLDHNKTFVIVNSLAGTALKSLSNLLTPSNVLQFNGDDAVGLFKGANLIDVVGTSSATKTTENMTLTRKSSISSPITTFNMTNDWTQSALDNFTGLGLHTMDILVAPTPISGTKTVGTSGNYATLALAITDLTTKGVSGAVTLNLTDPVYNLGSTSLSIGNIPSTSATNTVTIKPATGVTAAISGDVSGALINLNGADFVTIDGQNRKLTISNNSLISGSVSSAIYLGEGSDNNTIKGCIIAGQTGIQTVSNSNNIISSNKIVNNFTFSDISKSTYGIVLNSATNAEVLNNMITLTPLEGNLTNFNGISCISTTTAKIYNNSVYLAGTAAVGAISAALVYGTNPSVTSRNNILYNTKSGNNAYAVCIDDATVYSGIDNNYNLLFAPAANLCKVGVYIKTFSEWKTDTNLDLNSQNSSLIFETVPLTAGEIKYTRAAANAPVFNTGYNTGVAVDFYGINRPQYAAYDIGAYELEYNSDITETTLPAVNTLAQNYPNPFNPETTIGFTLAKNATVNLTVYNTRGEVVKSLINNSLNAGFHSVNFNAVGLNSGVYVYKLTTPDNSITKKMILLK